MWHGGGTLTVPAVLPAGEIIPQGTVLPFPLLIPAIPITTKGTPLTDSYNTNIPVFINPGVTFPFDITLPDGTTLTAGDPVPFGNNVYQPWNTMPIGSVLPFDAGTIIPAGATMPAGASIPWREYDMSNQNLRFEFGLNTQFQINNLSKNVLTDKLYADLLNLVNFTRSVQLSTEDEIRNRLLRDFPDLINHPDDLNQRIIDHQIKEDGMFRDVMFDRFNNMLRLLDVHASQISTEFTSLGSRMNRLEMITERLEQDRLSYTRLKSENENVDYLEVIMRLNAAESVYQASLMTGANIMQLSLADFIR
jgi:hypothetical protein